MKEGTFAVLLQFGLGNEWWADSTECYWYLRNIQDLLSDGKTPYERRFGMPFNGPVTPFRAMVECHPISAKDQSRIHQFGKKLHIFHPDTILAQASSNRAHTNTTQVRSGGSQVIVGKGNQRAEPVAVLQRAPTLTAEQPSLRQSSDRRARRRDPGNAPSAVHPAVPGKARHSFPYGQTIGKPANAVNGSTLRQSGCLLG